MSQWSQFPAHHIRGISAAKEMAEPIEITLNGAPRTVDAGTTVAQLLTQAGIAGGRVAVERNLDVVPRATYEQVTLENGDQLEIVAFVGGG